MYKRATIFGVVLLGISCQTAPIPSPSVIEVPPGVSLSQVQVAILTAITERPEPPPYDDTVVLGQAGDAIIWSLFKQSVAQQNAWFPESYSAGVIYAGLQIRSHYLRVAIRYDTEAVRTEIVESRNLDQSKTRIHENALVWVDRLNVKIRRALGQVAFRGVQ